MKMQEIIDSGQLANYEPGVKKNYYPLAEIEKKRVNNMICGKCLHVGLEYYPYRSDYCFRSFAVCPRCGDAKEL